MIPLSQRQQIVQWVDEASAAGARREQACGLLGIAPRTLQRWRQCGELPGDARSTRSYRPANKLSEPEREQIVAVANSKEFADLPPSQIVPRLADRGEYLASESTFYRVLRDAGQLQHRQASRAATAYKPRALEASAPNQVYSWDITYLKTSIRGIFLYLYLFMDIYSRKIVGWQVYEQESSEWAADIVHDIAQREGIEPEHITLHSDNGGPMKGASMLATLQALGIMPSFSRPSVSNDNPFSESLFKTLKYRPDYPAQPFADLTQARQWVSGFVHWYNFEHRHSAIGFVTPAQRHAGLDTAILAQRQALYQAAKARHPERWARQTRDWKPVQVVYLNPNKTDPKPSRSTLDRAA
jgi:transposase InsO family protein